jgi:hypothetical protein
MDVIDPKKCYSCGHGFRTPSDLLKHKNRKTPCLIREVQPDQLHNPNRCIYCNKILSKKENLTRHLKTCKVKNGGMDILDDKVRHEQDMRIMKEERNVDRKEIADIKRQNIEQIAKLEHQNALILKQLEMLTKQPVRPNNTINNTMNNTINNNTNIVLNNFQTPNLDGITITSEELIGIDNLPRYMLLKIYCNPDKPENHSVYFPNKKEPRVLFYDRLQWQSYTGEALKHKLTKLSNTTYISSRELFFGPRGLVANDDEELFNALPGSIQNIIIEQLQKVQVSHEDILEALLGSKVMIEKTKKLTDSYVPRAINNDKAVFDEAPMEVICTADDL